MPQQFCAEPGCGVLVAGGRCATHARAHRAYRSHDRGERWYDIARWKRLRLEVLQAEPLCRHCRARGRTIPTEDIDHIVKHAGDPGRFWDRGNLQGLCKACHTIKTARGE